MLSNQHRVDDAVSISGNVNNYPAAAGRHRLLTAAIAPIGLLVVSRSSLLDATLRRGVAHLRAQRHLTIHIALQRPHLTEPG